MEAKDIEEHLIGTSDATDEDLRIPRDVFRSRFRYGMVRHRLVLISLGLELAVIAVLIHMGFQADDKDDRIGITIFVILAGSVVMLSTGVITYCVVRGRAATLTNKLGFMKEIATVKPGIEMREWDIIAARMNPILHRSSSLLTPYFFYDGESCYSYFRSTYLQPYLNRKNGNEIFRAPVDDFQTFLDHVIKIYEERANEDWQRILNGSSSLGPYETSKY
ncbi:LANO_0C00276g1_1 [Lachancea nothofagi CBS 11611]|uniref:LANO_0C00276g1_1 n=1 Tax=Lachancea nothofagi CBS 11611 TaxID=1266666 RepID=A0A1G4J313_9SACH|nr:LANO_0C00276g1_1 [Lachancea nothofagi CBS 11611]